MLLLAFLIELRFHWQEWLNLPIVLGINLILLLIGKTCLLISDRNKTLINLL